MLTFRGKPLYVVPHALTGMEQERPKLDEWGILDCLEQSGADPGVDEKVELRIRRRNKIVIVRIIHRVHAYYVIGVSRTTA